MSELVQEVGKYEYFRVYYKKLDQDIGKYRHCREEAFSGIGTPANRDVLPFEKIKSSIFFYNLILVITRLLIG